jgi:hypothetical protein
MPSGNSVARSRLLWLNAWSRQIPSKLRASGNDCQRFLRHETGCLRSLQHLKARPVRFAIRYDSVSVFKGPLQFVTRDRITLEVFISDVQLSAFVELFRRIAGITPTAFRCAV